MMWVRSTAFWVQAPEQRFRQSRCGWVCLPTHGPRQRCWAVC